MDYFQENGITSEQIKNLHFFFAKTEYGKVLAQNIRYEIYKPKKMNNSDWIALLGPDVCNLNHALVIFEITYGFLIQCACYRLPLFNEERKTLLLSAIIHDWGEAVVGDITKDRKTEDDMNKESHALKKICSELIPQYQNGILRPVLQTAIDNVFGDPNLKLCKIFSIIENLGYMDTCIKAWQAAKTNPDIARNLYWICANTVIYSIPFLQKKQTKYPLIAEFFTAYQKLIPEIINFLPLEIYFEYCDIQAARTKQATLIQLKNNWLEN